MTISLDPGSLEPVAPTGVDQTTDRDEADVKLLGSLAVAHSQFGRNQTAARLLDLARWIKPSHPRTWELMAVIRMRQGRYQEAAAAVATLELMGIDVPPTLAIAKERAEAVMAAQKKARA